MWGQEKEENSQSNQIALSACVEDYDPGGASNKGLVEFNCTKVKKGEWLSHVGQTETD